MTHSSISGIRTEQKNRRKNQARRHLSAALAACNAGGSRDAGTAAWQGGDCAASGAVGGSAMNASAMNGSAAGFAALKSGALAGSRRSKSGAAKRRRGRPRLEGKLREPNGRIARAKKPAALLALQARAFHTGLTLEQARDPRAETYLGRLAIFGRGDGLSGDQYQAAQDFLALRNDYRRSLLSPGAYYEATGIRLGEDNMAEYSAWAARVKKRYSEALRAVQEAQMDNGRENIYAALQYVIIDGRELPYLLGAVRLALNALHRCFTRSGDKAQSKTRRLEQHSISLAGMGSRH